jgi:hypothetical protein
VISQTQDIPESILVCPSHQLRHTGWKNTLSECEFYYIYWPKAVRDSLPAGTKLPLIYDRSLADHGKYGICIGLESGATMCDPDATWLKAFAAQHPQVAITIPK